MFQFTKQQIDTFQRHANKQARKRLLESLIEEGVEASEQQESGAVSERTIGVDECDRVRRVIDRWGRDHADRLDRRLEYDKENRSVAELNVSDGNALASFAYDDVGNMIQDNGRSIFTLGTFVPGIFHVDEPVEYTTFSFTPAQLAALRRGLE